jgi:hypothetical protein
VKIAYLSTDEVNQDLAERLAAKSRVGLDLVSPRDPAPNGEYDAVVYDLDSWPQPQRAEVLSRLGNGRTLHAVAVHSYSLDEDQVEALRAQGVFVHRRLDAEVFEVLRAMRSQTEARSVQVLIGGITPALQIA